jgi:hypothetical protein
MLKEQCQSKGGKLFLIEKWNYGSANDEKGVLSCNSGIISLYVPIMYPMSLNLFIICFRSSNALCGSLGCSATLIISGFCLIKRLKHLSSLAMFTIFFSEGHSNDIASRRKFFTNTIINRVS